jgi:hypothetical protein
MGARASCPLVWVRRTRYCPGHPTRAFLPLVRALDCYLFVGEVVSFLAGAGRSRQGGQDARAPRGAARTCLLGPRSVLDRQ